MTRTPHGRQLQVRAARRAWLGGGLYVAASVAPLLIMLVPPYPPPSTFWRELSVALAFAGLALMCLQFVPTARLRVLADVYPSDTLYKHHRHIATVGALMALAHVAILLVATPWARALLNPVTAPWRARWALLGTVLMVLLVATSLARRALRLPYPVWRWTHVVASVVMAVAFFCHMFLVGRHSAHPLMRAYWVTMALVWVAAVLHARVLRPRRIARRPYSVVGVRPERGDTWTLELAPEAGSALRFLPGQFAWISIDRSAFTLSDNPFSFSSSAERTDRVEFAIRENGDFTSTVKTLDVGQRVLLDGPFGTFDLDQHEGPGYVFIAGGSGIVPVMSILRTMADRNDRSPAILFDANPSLEAATFREEIDQLAGLLCLDVVHVLSREASPGHEFGLVDEELLDRRLPDDRYEREYFICGPAPMTEAVTQALDRLGVPLGKVHTEHYLMA